MENRKSPPYPVLCPISFSGDHMAGEGTVVNLSGHGCSVGSEKDAKEGTYLALYVFLPDHASPMKVDQAVVRWSMEGAFGLEFLHMEPEEQERLRRFVSALEAGPSRRKRRAYTRLPIQFPISFSGEDIVGEGTVIDLSKRGSKATVASSTQRVRPGTHLAVRLYVPDDGLPMEVYLAAVRWAKGQEFGLEFLTIRSEEEERLRRFLDKLEAEIRH